MWNMRVDDEDDKESEAGEYDGDVASWQASWIEPSKPQCQHESI